jgi:carotenoid cleavage dioxygenase-like enzyme
MDRRQFLNKTLQTSVTVSSFSLLAPHFSWAKDLVSTDPSNFSRKFPVGPYFQSALYAPVRTEIKITHNNLKIDGQIPNDLNGDLYINSSNAKYNPRGVHHWFDGDGMIYHYSFRNGEVNFQNKWIQTDKLLAETKANKNLTNGTGLGLRLGLAHKFGRLGGMEMFSSNYSKIDTANTTVTHFDDKLFNAWYFGAGKPYQMNPSTLDTTGKTIEINGKKITRMSAHPKVNPKTNEMFFFSYNPTPNKSAADQKVIKVSRWKKLTNGKDQLIQLDIPLNGPRNIHDMGLALDKDDPKKGYLLIFDCPTAGYLGDIKKDPTRVGLIPLDNFKNSAVKWITISPGYILHVANCYMKDKKIILKANQIGAPPPSLNNLVPTIPAVGIKGIQESKFYLYLLQWEFNYNAGSVKELGHILKTPKDQNSLLEFPTYDLENEGMATDFYIQKLAPEKYVRMSKVYRFTPKNIVTEVHSVNNDQNSVGECRFVPKKNSKGSGEGYLLVNEYYPETTKLFIYKIFKNGHRLEATIDTDGFRLSVGFHNTWAPYSVVSCKN